MKISTKGRYGLTLMISLAKKEGQGYVSLKSIAEENNLSDLQLEQLVGTLRNAGLIRSVRGAKGGYSLTRNPKNITIKNIIDVVEGPISISDCIEKDANCDNLDKCATRVLWVKIRDAIDNIFSSVTLQDIIDEHNKLNFLKIEG